MYRESYQQQLCLWRFFLVMPLEHNSQISSWIMTQQENQVQYRFITCYFLWLFLAQFSFFPLSSYSKRNQKSLQGNFYFLNWNRKWFYANIHSKVADTKSISYKESFKMLLKNKNAWFLILLAAFYAVDTFFFLGGFFTGFFMLLTLWLFSFIYLCI